MKNPRTFAWRWLLLALSFASALAVAAEPDPARTRAYIDQAWDTLTRRVEDCSALADPKVTTHPVVYVPADAPADAALAAIARRCGVELRPLPRTIARIGDLDPHTLPQQGLLYLPKPYVVPGGFFNEMYGWDSFFIVLGLVADGRAALARDMVDNFLYQVEHYGGVLNANRSYYLTRSQPPFLGAMIRAVLDDGSAFKDKGEADAWLAHAYPLALRDHATWTRPEHRAGDTGLARYFDYGSGPVLEMRDAGYLRKVIEWLRAHPDRDPGWLVAASERPDAAEAARLKDESCDVVASPVCRDAWADGHRLRADFYLGDRAMRESGFDVNFHFGPFAGATHHYAPVCLNSLLYAYEHDLAGFAQRLGKADDAARFEREAAARKTAIDRYLWQPQSGTYADYDFVAGKHADDPYVTALYPLWAGAASPEQAAALRGKLALFEHPGGLAMSRDRSGAQWDAPFGWAPVNWLVVSGLDRYGFRDDAQRIARAFTATIDRALAHDGTIREKYNMETGDADVQVTVGYSDNVVGFGWSNGVYLKLRELLQAPADTSTGERHSPGGASGDFDGAMALPAFTVPFSAYASPESLARFREVLAEGKQAPGFAGGIDAARAFYDRINRSRAERMQARYPVKLSTGTIAGVDVDIVEPAAGVAPANRNRALIVLHGGAFLWGEHSGALVEAIPVAALSGMRAIGVDYRQGPEHVFPAATEDVVAVYKALTEQYPAANIGIYGCSAGGMLTGQVVARLIRDGTALPGAIGTFCGSIVPLGGDSAYVGPPLSGDPIGSGPVSIVERLPYFKGASADDPLVIPANDPAMLARFPPTLLISGTRDFAMSSVLQSHRLLTRAGVQADLHVWDGMWHSFFSDPELPESQEAYAVMAAFFDRHLGR
ncbi:trehalase family glycosidase [Pseudoxanthomonas putridarboris]|uniref:Trehalase family glycosidase n=1 Tax=Pseudoxanthomonas putridarboris TaxID=752605 RepID=A0ABU9J2A7_9GAMM